MSDRPGTASRAWSVARDWVRRAPGTYLWLTVLGVTWLIGHVLLTHHQRYAWLSRSSTNLANLGDHPIRALLTSALVFDGGTWLLWAALYTVFHAPVERRIGTLRWFGVAALGHVLATYVSQGIVAVLLSTHQAPARLEYTLDFGVSYALAAVQGVTTWLVPRRWRWPWLAALLVGYLLPFAWSASFTTVGHLVAALIGVACRPLARPRTAGRSDRALSARRRPPSPTP